jgi:pyruvyltransferase
MDFSFTKSSKLVLENGAIPLTWWTNTPNFGDLLSPYLVKKLTSLPVNLVGPNASGIKRLNPLVQDKFSYLAIGSIISRANSRSVVWGSGAFGTENEKNLSKLATYLAVRGPLTRNLLRIHGINCPAVYGDPALLIPNVFSPVVEKKYKVGVILRWAEKQWNSVSVNDDVKKIYLGTDDIEGTILDMLQCENIVSSSLHGIILADAYGIPSAWLSSETPKGLEFKFYDYFLSVSKLQKPQVLDFSAGQLTSADIFRQLVFNERKIEFNESELIRACPFIEATN